MCHHHDHAAGIGELAQHRHHLAVQRGIQARGGLVEDQQRRTGQQFHRHRGAFALATGEPVDSCLRVRRQLEFVEHLRDHLAPILLGGVRRQPQLGRVAQRLLDGELAMHDVVLRHHADTTAQRRVLGVDVVPLERHFPAGGIAWCRR